MSKDKKHEIISETKSKMKKYGQTQDVLSRSKQVYEDSIDKIMKKPKGFGYGSFLSQDLLFKLLKDKNRKNWKTLSPLGIIYLKIVLQTSSMRDIGPYMLSFFSDKIKKK